MGQNGSKKGGDNQEQGKRVKVQDRFLRVSTALSRQVKLESFSKNETYSQKVPLRGNRRSKSFTHARSKSRFVSLV